MARRLRHPTERFALNDDWYVQALPRCRRRPLPDPMVSDVYGRLWRVRRRSPSATGTALVALALLLSVLALGLSTLSA
jgi:hypothetical protein